MSVTTLHGLAPVKIGNSVIAGITATDNGVNSDIRDEPSSGELAARIQALIGQKVIPTFTTQDIAVALAACGALGCALATYPLTLFAPAYGDDGRRAANGHVQYHYQHGLLLPQSLDCTHQGDATLSYQGLVTWDGTHDPLVITAGASLPAISATSLWTLSTVVLAGVTIPQLKSVKINFGIKAETEGADSDIWDTKPSISAVQPTIDVTSSKVAALLDLLGESGSCSVVFRERDDGGTFSGHTLTLAGTGMASFTKPFGASGNKPGESTLQARPKFDGVNDPITITRNW